MINPSSEFSIVSGKNVVEIISNMLENASGSLEIVLDLATYQELINEINLNDIFKALKINKTSFRIVTEISNFNIYYCNEMIQYVNIRHFEGLRANFAVSDTDYVALIKFNNVNQERKLIYSKSAQIIDFQKDIFQTIWNRATPAQDRIYEIQSGIQLPRVEVIHEQSRSLEILQRIIDSAMNEIILVSPTQDAIKYLYKSGIIDKLHEMAQGNVSLEIKMLIPCRSNDKLFEISKQFTNAKNVNIRELNKESDAKTLFIVCDRKSMLMMDLNNKSADAVASVSIYSDSYASIMNYISIFENLWKQIELYEQLQDYERMQKEFIDVAAHELRTPVMPILGRAELLKSEVGNIDEKSLIEAIDMIIRNANRLGNLTDDLLTISKIERKVLVLRKENFDLAAIIQEAIKDMEGQMHSGKVKILFDRSISCGPEVNETLIEADKNKITRVIYNLLNNALKFTDAGVIIICLQKHDEGFFKVTVSDTGIGIDPSIMHRLFTKFMTGIEYSKAGNSRSGAGLGLYLSKGIIEAHGGKIWAENNNEGRGTKFSILLPSSRNSLY